MTKVILTPKAKSDLNQIWHYSLENWGVEQTETYIRKLWADLHKFAAEPGISVAADEIRKGFRKGRSGSHIVFFKALGPEINVIRILHQSMDFNRHF